MHMKKIISLIVAMLMLVAIFAACTPEEQPSGSPTGSVAAGPFDDVKPLDQPVTIRIASLSGMEYGVIPYLIDELGGFEKANISFDGDGQVYGNGATLMEAAGSWDVAATGLGGMIGGTISKNCVMTSLTVRDEGCTYFWAQKDSKIAKAGISNIG